VGEDVGNLRDDERFRGESNRRGGTRYAEDHPAADCTGDGPGEHGRSPDLIIALHPEELPKAINLLFEEGGDRLYSTVIVCQAGTAINDDTVAGFEGLVQLASDGFDLVGYNRIMRDRDLCFGQDCLDSFPADVRFVCPCCRNGDHRTGYWDRLDVFLFHNDKCSGNYSLIEV
jgi:hypothetical protein